MAKNAGKIFEEDIKKSCLKDGLFVHRIRDNAMSYTESETSYTKENPYDFIIYKMPYLLTVELKHTTYPSISIQVNEDDDKKKMIKYHQIKELQKASEHDGIKAGFILSFHNKKIESESTFYISIDNFIDFLTMENKKSINMLDIVQYHGVRVEQRLLRSHYYYNISNLIEKI